MSIIDFFLFFVLMIITGSPVITGWFFITRGRYEYLVDGTRVIKGKLFAAFYLYFMRTRPIPDFITYKGTALQQLLKDHGAGILECVSERTIESDDMTFCTSADGRIVVCGARIFDHEQLMAYGAKHGISFSIENDYVPYLYAFKAMPDYVFPEWLRNPVAVCVTCFASVYGSVFYGSVLCLAKMNLFAWTDFPLLSKIFFWIAYCMALAVTNTAITKKFA